MRRSSCAPCAGCPGNSPPSRRLLILSRFPPEVTRITAGLATRRNEFVAALADDVWFAHISANSRMQALALGLDP